MKKKKTRIIEDVVDRILNDPADQEEHLDVSDKPDRIQKQLTNNRRK